MNISSFKFSIIYLIGFFLIFLIGYGYFGEGIDVVYSYRLNENVAWKASEFAGGFLATLTFSGFYLGVYASSLILFLALYNFYKKELFFSPLIFSFVIFTLMFSWPFFLGVSNALRQGLSLSCLIILLSIIKNNPRFFYSPFFILFFLILLFSHSYGSFLAINFILFFILHRYFSSIRLISIFSGLFLIIFDSFILIFCLFCI
jgi:hypothetical protein